MPRKPRELSLTGLYHIIIRGNDRNDIFYDNQDRHIFLKILEETKEKFKIKIYSYCLMSNHVHIVLKIKDEFLSKAMQSLGIKYSLYFNKKINRNGHLFQNRFFSKKIENLNYFLTVCKYVHRNPEKAMIDKTENYKWSSFKEYVGKEKLINRKVLLHYFNNDISEFKRYTLENDDKEQLYNLAEFELIRKLTEEELSEIIKDRYELENASDITLLDEEQRSRIILGLREIKGTSLAQISRVTRITEYFIKNIWK